MRPVALPSASEVLVALVVGGALFLPRVEATTLGTLPSSPPRKQGKHNSVNGTGNLLARCGVHSVAIYFPGFHHSMDNDQIWGYRWTEWDNLHASDLETPLADDLSVYRNGKPDKLLHPKRGYYDIGDREGQTLRAQAAEAKAAGISAFMIYHYWFAFGRGPLTQPIERAIFGSVRNNKRRKESPGIGISFFFSWANEAWQRRWNAANTGAGRRNDSKITTTETFIPQNFGGPLSWTDHFLYLLQFFRLDEYVKINGKPVFAIYDTFRMNTNEDREAPSPASCVTRESEGARCGDGVPFGCPAAELFLSWYPHLSRFLKAETAYLYYQVEGRLQGYSWPRADPCEPEHSPPEDTLRAMLELWEKLAIDHGFPGIHIIVTVSGFHPVQTTLADATSRARKHIGGVLQFLPASSKQVFTSSLPLAPNLHFLANAACGITPLGVEAPSCECLLHKISDTTFDEAYLSAMESVGLKQPHHTFMRGAFATWSSYPRHRVAAPTEFGSSLNVFAKRGYCHTQSAQAYRQLIQVQLGRALEDSASGNYATSKRRSARGVGTTPSALEVCALVASNTQASSRAAWRHLVVTNAWNEWGEQAVIEPSVQFGDSLLAAHEEAVRSFEIKVQHRAL